MPFSLSEAKSIGSQRRRFCADRLALRAASAALLVAAAAVLAGCQSEPPVAVQPASTRTVEVLEIEPTADRDVAQLIGRIEPGQEVTLYFEVVGVVEQVFVEEGAEVKSGDPIARLALQDYQFALSQAKAEYQAAKAAWELMVAGSRKEDIDLARADFERTKARRAYWNNELERVQRLVESRAISESEFQQVSREHDAAVQEELMAKAGLDRAIAGNRKEEIAAAAANVEARRQAAILADRQLQKATLKAPFHGRVERRLVDPGAYINVFPMGGVPVVHLVDLEHVDAVISVPEAMLGRFAVGQSVAVASAVNAQLRASGSVTHVGQIADRASGTYDVRVRLPNPDNRFTGGMVVVAEADDAAPRDAIRVPVTAIRRAYGQLPYVLLVSRDTRQVVERDVELGPINGDEVEITNGLTGGELLVVRGQHVVVAGDLVQYEPFNKVPIARKPGPPP